MSDGRLFARNSALNLIGLGLPLLVAIVAIPPLMRGLGAERFAILTLAWAAIGYFSLFEFGLSRALTQAVAQRLGNGSTDDLAALTWSALLLLFALGALGGVVLAAITPLLVQRALNVPLHLRAEAITSFYVLALSLPLVLMSVGLRGVLEAHQDFGAATALRALLVAFMFIGPLLALPFSSSLVPAIVILAAGRAVGLTAHLALCLKRYAFMRHRFVLRHAPLRPLLRFGGWTTVTNIVSPMMVVLDRFLIGVMLPLSAIAHYVTPYEVIVKLLVIPGAILGAMFPSFAAMFERDAERVSRLYERSLRVVVLLVFPLVLCTVTFAREGLLLWLGPELPHASAIVLQWLAVGVFINSIGQAPYVALQGAGRPDLIAKLHLLELPLYVACILFFVRAFGLPGVAIAWTLRVAVDAFALFVISRRRLHLALAPGVRPATIMLMLAGFAMGAAIEHPLVKSAYVLAVAAVFVPTAWQRLLTPSERHVVRGWLRKSEPLPRPEGAG